MERTLEHAILEPVPGDEPAGPHLFYTGVFDQIREAVREDNPNLSQGVWQAEIKQANWPEARRLCREVLSERSRDLRVAVWYTHAAIEIDGAAGLEEGIRIIAGLTRSFSDSLHPTDPEHRVAAYEWMDRSCALRAKSLPVCSLDDGERFTWADREMSLFLERKGLVIDDTKRDSPYVSRDRIQSGIRRTDTALYRNSAESVTNALKLCDELREHLDQLYGKEAPAFTELRAVLSEMMNFFTTVWREREPARVEPDPESDLEVLADETPVFVGREANVGPIRSRSEAYRRLREAAEFLFRAEPHSPAPYLIQRAISWGDMTLSELLLEILRDHQDIRQIYSLLGITDRQPEGQQ